MLLLLIAHLAAALVAPVLVRWWGRRAFVLLALVPGSAAIWALRYTDAVAAGEGPTVSIPWLPSLGIDLSFRMDTLSWLMVLMVGGIGAAVLVYCSRYFSTRSKSLERFAAILTAFAGAMLGLVISSNMIQIYVFWELTTVFSYLLIGHYSDRASSRRAAMKAILVTTFGGLAMLVGILLLGAAAGTYDVHRILASPPAGSIVSLAIALILVGAISKSALFPLHFWLPSAMAAPTPVSAYLHAAAMVKAGVYLVARLAPGFSTLPVWDSVVPALGLGTLLYGGFLALRQHDLKLILAFGTVSQLGLLITLVGSTHKATALAGLALLGAHAMFKACLFLVVGLIDAVTGTRDQRRLSGLGRKMPGTAVVAGLATASMIGLFPFAGYVAKEAALEYYLEAGQGSGRLVTAAFILGSILTVGYGVRFWWGAFASKKTAPARYPVVATAPPLLLSGPPALLAVAGLIAALFPGTGERLLSPHAASYPSGDPGHLVLWGGFTPALGTTILILGAGFGLFLLRGQILKLRTPWPAYRDADWVYRHALRTLDRFAIWLTSSIQRGSLPFYLGVIFLVMLVAAGGAMVTNGAIPDNLVFGGRLARIPVVALVVTATILATRSRRRLKAVVLAGVTGYGTAMTFLLYGAPDLALTQVMVETVTLVVFVLVLRRLPVYFSDRPLAAGRWVRLAVGSAVGLLVVTLAMLSPAARIHDPISELFPDEAVEFGGGRNIVNVTLVDIRAWDTMGEISVLLVAATGVASLIFLSRRTGDPIGPTEQSVGRIGAADPDPIARLRSRPTSSTRNITQWLVGGVTLAPQRRSVILEVATRILFHTMVVFGLFLLFSGHNLPGGGFVAGLVTGIGFVVRYLAGGRYELSAAAPLQAHVLLGTGLVMATGTGIASMVFGASVLQSAIIRATLPVFGDVKLVTSVFFDLGVYLIVVGLILDILKSLGAEIDRHGEESGHDSDLVGPALEPAPPQPRRPR